MPRPAPSARIPDYTRVENPGEKENSLSSLDWQYKEPTVKIPWF